MQSKRPSIIGLAAAVIGISGCASSNDGSLREAHASMQYRTGSNLPVRNEYAPATPEERARAEEQIRLLKGPGGAGRLATGSN